MPKTNHNCHLCNKTLATAEMHIQIGVENVNIVFPNSNLDLTETSIICNECSVKVLEFRTFKETVMSNEDLMEVKYLGTCTEEFGSIKPEKPEICRFCLNQERGSFTNFRKIENAVKWCISEVNISNTSEVLICCLCLVTLQTYFHFLEDCLKVRNTLKRSKIHDKHLDDSEANKVDFNDEIYYDKPRSKMDISEQDSPISNHNHNKTSHKVIPHNPLISWHKCNQCEYQTKRKVHLKLHSKFHRKQKVIQMFNCAACSFQTIRKERIRRHALTHRPPNSENLLKCPSCDFQSLHKEDIRNHEEIHRVYLKKCILCSYKTNSAEEMKKHTNTHEMLQCSECNFRTMYKASLTAHKNQHLGPGEFRTYSCDQCSYKSKRFYYLKNHKLLHEKSDSDKLSPTESQKQPLNAAKRIKSSGDPFTESKMDDSEPLDTNCEKTANNSELPKSPNQDDQKLIEFETIKCEINEIKTEPDISFDDDIKPEKIDDIFDHKETNIIESKETNFVEPKETHKSLIKCEFNQIRMNSAEEQNEAKTFSCQMKRKDNRYKCDQCSYETNNMKYIKYHKLVHQNGFDVVIYSCDSCGYQTKHMNHLTRHKQIHEIKIDLKLGTEKIFECEDCGHKTKTKSANILHKKLHLATSFKCDSCSYETKYKFAMKKHSLVHTNPDEGTTFKCEKCSYTTLRKGNIQRHVKMHISPAKLNMLKCDQCQYQTHNAANFKCHKLIHLNLEEIDIQKFETSTELKSDPGIKILTMLDKSAGVVNIFQCLHCNHLAKQKHYIKKHMLIHEDVQIK